MTRDEHIRYSRHTVLTEVGAEGQERLKRASVLCVGAGGLGSPLLLYLAAAGVGRIGLIDGDVVQLSNLHRQVLYGYPELGSQKVDAAAERLNQMNPDCTVKRYAEFLNERNAIEIIPQYDVVVDGTDNFTTRYLINDACVLLGKPNVHGAVFQFEGQVSVFDASRGPCYRCIFPSPPEHAPNCAEAGVLGVLPGIIGTYQALEVLKLLLGVGEPLIGRLLMLDAMGSRWRELRFKKNPECPLCGERPTIKEVRAESFRCDTIPTEPTMEVPVITPTELRSELESESPPLLVDVREPFELEISHFEGAQTIPMGELGRRYTELDPEADLVVVCRTGNRSEHATAFLLSRGFKRVRNLAGGINGWADEVDPSVRKY